MTEERFIRIKNTPIRIIVIFLLFSLVLFSIGAFDWKNDNPILFYTLQMVYIFSLWLGYKNHINKPVRTGIDWCIHERRILRLLPYILIINFFMFLIESIRSYGFSSFDLVGLITSTMQGVLNMGESYFSKVDVTSTGGAHLLGGNFFTVLHLLWWFLELNGVLLGIIYYKKVFFFTKTLILLNLMEIVVYYVSIGTNIGIFRILLAIVLFWSINIIKRGKLVKGHWRSPNMKRIILLVSIFSLFVISFLVQTLSSRGGILYWNKSWYNICGIGINFDSVLFRYLPDELHIVLVSVSSYLTQGYQAFAYSLNVSWNPMFGLGHSYQIVQLITRYLFDISQFTYQYKIEQIYGWDMAKNWASAYTWIANDVSLLGVPFVLYFFGKLLALSYKESLFSENAYSKIIFYFLLLTCVFLPCNFQVFQFVGTYFSFIFAFIMWLSTTRVRFKFSLKK